MAYEEKYRAAEAQHTVVLEGRSRAAISGVTDVDSFDETAVALNTARGALTVRGEGLHMEKLSLESGEVVIAGDVRALEYEEETAHGGGLLSRFFR